MKKNTSGNEINFDDFSDEYIDLMNQQHAKYGDIEYYSEHKAKITSNIFNMQIINILEFGCGIGRNLPYLKNKYSNANIFASDISSASLTIAKQNNPDVMIIDDALLNDYTGKFDLIFIAGVYHHIPINLRSSVSKKVYDLLTENGKIICFEHNPYNPLTRHMVNTCVFDEDAILLTKNELIDIFTREGFSVLKSGYTLFVPPKLKRFNKIENWLEWLPLGGQYYVAFDKN